MEEVKITKKNSYLTLPLSLSLSTVRNSTTISLSPSSFPCCNTRENKKKETYASAQIGKTAANTAHHCREEPSHSPVSNHQLPPSSPSTTTPLETKEENRNREEKHRKNMQRRRRRTNHWPNHSPISNRQQYHLEATAGPPLFLHLLPPPLHLLQFPPPLFTLHVDSGE